ncbi:MAG: E3 ubiquitin-protein ligase APD1-4 domain-containing protein [Candidatus Kariarchaeaceae archaeon]|jgi:hypothetical protein
MRRGGGSRGGGFRGGGSRGGGSRGYRTSRRHHSHYHGGYHRRGYYYGYGGGGGAIVVLIIFIGIFLVIGMIVSIALLSSSTDYNVNLGPNETRLFKPGSFWKSGVEVQDTSNTIQTHFFDSKPSLLPNTIDRLESGSDYEVKAFEYEYWGFYLIETSTVNIAWSSTSGLVFWIVEGNDNFQKWEEGEDQGTKFTETTSLTQSFTAPSDADYYFILENNRGSSIVTYSFDVKLKAYDISNSKGSERGSFEQSGFDYEYLVLYNPSGSDITFLYKENPRFSAGAIFAVEVVIIVGIILLFRRSRRSKKTQPSSGGKIPTQSEAQIYQDSMTSTPPVQVKYNQRPSAKFCTACGSGVLPSSAFCTECGATVK